MRILTSLLLLALSLTVAAADHDQDNHIAEADSLPPSVGDAVSVPYGYTAVPCREVPALVRQNAGATLFSGSRTNNF